MGSLLDFARENRPDLKPERPADKSADWADSGQNEPAIQKLFYRIGAERIPTALSPQMKKKALIAVQRRYGYQGVQDYVKKANKREAEAKRYQYQSQQALSAGISGLRLKQSEEVACPPTFELKEWRPADSAEGLIANYAGPALSIDLEPEVENQRIQANYGGTEYELKMTLKELLYRTWWIYGEGSGNRALPYAFAIKNGRKKYRSEADYYDVFWKTYAKDDAGRTVMNNGRPLTLGWRDLTQGGIGGDRPATAGTYEYTPASYQNFYAAISDPNQPLELGEKENRSIQYIMGAILAAEMADQIGCEDPTRGATNWGGGIGSYLTNINPKHDPNPVSDVKHSVLAIDYNSAGQPYAWHNFFSFEAGRQLENPCWKEQWGEFLRSCLLSGTPMKKGWVAAIANVLESLQGEMKAAPEWPGWLNDVSAIINSTAVLDTDRAEWLKGIDEMRPQKADAQLTADNTASPSGSSEGP